MRTAEIETCEGLSCRYLTFVVRQEESNKGENHLLYALQIMKILRGFGVPYGSRTRVAAVKGRCPRPLDERDTRC